MKLHLPGTLFPMKKTETKMYDFNTFRIRMKQYENNLSSILGIIFENKKPTINTQSIVI